MIIVAVPASDVLDGEVVQAFQVMQYSCVGSDAVESLPAKDGRLHGSRRCGSGCSSGKICYDSRPPGLLVVVDWA